MSPLEQAARELESLRSRLTSTSVVLRCLPANPGFNGSVLLIDDVEAARCSDDIDAALQTIDSLIAALAAPPAPAVPLTPEAVAWALAEENGEDPGHLIWQGNPPEPWGEVWCRYMPQAERLLARLAAKPTEGEPR